MKRKTIISDSVSNENNLGYSKLISGYGKLKVFSKHKSSF
jgi:hypothetical protein